MCSCWLACVSGNSQNFSSLGKEKPFALTGGVALNQVMYASHGVSSRRSPYTYFASGNINISLYGWSVPFSFSVSNQNVSFQQPFNQYSLHPTYKWFTAHVGYTSMTYSPYTVSGHLFLGGAVDAAPEGKWKFGALYGRFLKKVKPDTVNGKSTIPSYERMGYGFKTNFSDGSNSVDLIVFHAKDKNDSIPMVSDGLPVFPEENLVMSIGAGKTFFEHLTLKGELAGSAIARNIVSEKDDTIKLPTSAEFLHTSRTSIHYYKALKTSLNYQFDAYTMGVAYERIDPQYRTLGAYYFNSDLENITVNTTGAILQGKMNVAVSAGTQRDNLDKSKISTMRRMVGSINMSYVPSQKINLSASYSSFQTYTNIRSQFVNINQLTPYDNLDTLNFTQLSKSASLNALYMFGKSEKRKQNMNVNMSYQGASDKQGDAPQNAGSQFYNLNTAYAMNFVPHALSISVSLNATLNKNIGMSTTTLGPTVALNKSFFDKKLRTSLSSSYNNTYSDIGKVNTILNGRISATTTFHKKHNINMSTIIVNRKTETTPFTEFTGTIGYSYAFGTK
jgi:hypothetical protein